MSYLLFIFFVLFISTNSWSNCTEVKMKDGETAKELFLQAEVSGLNTSYMHIGLGKGTLGDWEKRRGYNMGSSDLNVPKGDWTCEEITYVTKIGRIPGTPIHYECSACLEDR